MENTEMKKIIDRQRTFFQTGTTLDVSFRIAALKRLQHMIRRHEKEIEAALLLDLKKSSFESYMCETGLVLDEIHYMLRHIRSFAKEQDVRTPLAQFCSRSYRKPSPYGVTLIVSPWNYPILLTLDPLIDAIAARKYGDLKAKCLLSCLQRSACKTDPSLFSGKIPDGDHRRTL